MNAVVVRDSEIGLKGRAEILAVELKEHLNGSRTWAAGTGQRHGGKHYPAPWRELQGGHDRGIGRGADDLCIEGRRLI
jgi:hypothetical protein